MMTLQHSIPAAIVAFLGAVTPSVVAEHATESLPAATAPGQQAVAPLPGCRNEQGLTYICDLSVPEDILTVGSSGLLLVSGHRAPGHLYLIDPATRAQSELIHGATFRLQHDTRAYPDCPGPLNLQAFDVHGLSLTETSPRHFSLYTTSHGVREAIEIYDLDLRGTAPMLTWKGCVVLQQDSYHNSVARLADGGFVATRMRDQNFKGGGGAPVGITGHLVEWHPGGQPQRLADTDMSLPNGIDVSKDERYIYVAAIGSQELVRFDRRSTPMAKRTVSLPIRPDNVHWATDGKLLTAGPNYVPPGQCSGAGCATGWSVLEVDPETFAFSRLGGADQTAAMQRVSSAMRVGDDIWVGSNDDRIARFSLRRP
ncbi:MAG: SMP-30/gluconolactonase/LRE family protein [Acidimicrobiia bacterium]|nr:SMP-30/gluconolactonase/LRE family protein [Acidimicrobiia bacterium]